MSLPVLSLLTEDGEERSLEAEGGRGGRDPLSPLTPRLAPTFRAQALSPIWLSETSPPPLAQMTGVAPTIWEPCPALHPGMTSSWEPGGGQAAFSLLHAAAITGDTEGEAGEVT